MQRAVAGKVVLVTGASSGIGAATAVEFGRHLAHVVLAARRADRLEETAAQIVRAGGRAVAVPTDVTDWSEVTALVARAIDVFGPVDVLVNGAGANWSRAFAETTVEEIGHILSVNLAGPMQLALAVLPEMQRRRTGTIISIGSVAGHVAIEPLYSAAKFGVRGFSLALRRQLAGTGISVCLVSPGNIRTEMTAALEEDMPGPEVVARAIVGLAERPRREVIIPWKYRGVVQLDQLVPTVADAAFSWRHRAEHGTGRVMPEYARSVEPMPKTKKEHGSWRR
jgi:NAD(P)-dependent dehydrogenase (short-subunit alcohol dehydrogenase family)